MRTYLAPFALLYAIGVQVRSSAFNRGVLRSTKVKVPVISIGNITAGGTGKTPLTALLAKRFAQDRKRVTILSRGYKGKVRGIEEVATSGNAAKYGDEPFWLAQELKGIARVFVGAKKVAAAQQAEETADVLIADDAFQHRYLARDFDLVIIDATEPLEHYFPLPWGQGRESFSSLQRAHAIVINKVNLASEAWLRKLRMLIRDHARPQISIFEVSYLIRELESLKTHERIELSDLGGQKVLLVSGIGRPKAFEKLFNHFRIEIVDHVIFPDHHHYSQNDFSEIERRAAKGGAQFIISTEKDAVKFGNWLPELPLFMSRLELASVQLEELYETIRRHIFSRN